MKFSPLLDSLIRELQILPGVGPKLLEKNKARLML
jgi:recombinational DNA repair protein RecR